MSSFPEPKRAELLADLREYTRQSIAGWPLQRRGIVPQNAAGAMNTLTLASLDDVMLNELFGITPLRSRRVSLDLYGVRWR